MSGAPCNICGVPWPSHVDACAYVANARMMQSASAEANALRLRLKVAEEALREIIAEDEVEGDNGEGPGYWGAIGMCSDIARRGLGLKGRFEEEG